MASARAPFRWNLRRRGTGRPLLLLHGLGLSSFFWEWNLEPLSCSFQAIAPDLPGFGRSGRLLRYRWESVVSLLKSLIDELRLDAFDLVGHSMGGALACELAVDLRERVGKLILVAPAGYGGVSPLPFRMRIASGVPLGEFLLLFRTRSAIRYFMRWQGFFEPRYLTEEMVDAVAEGSPRAFLTMGREILKRDITARLSEIRAPTLIVWGERDIVTPPAALSIFQEGIRDSRVLLLKDCGHLAQIEQAETFNREAQRFLKRPG